MVSKGLAGSVYESLFGHGIDGIFLATEDGGVLRANPRACDLLGHFQDVLRAADDAMYAAKNDGAGRFHWHSPPTP